MRFGRGFIGRQDLKGGPSGFEQPIPIPVLPTATTTAATGIGATGGTLNGTVNPNGQIDAHYQFQWGTTVAYGNTTPSTDAGVGTSNVAASAALTGLTTGQTYHYRVVATNANGTVYGTDQTFVPVTGPPPTVTTNPASGLGGGAATLNATVNPQGTDTHVYFQWGTTTSYGNTTVSQDEGSGSSNVNVSQNLTGLTSNTIYHYRAVATSANGTTYGTDQTFQIYVMSAGLLIRQRPPTDLTVSVATPSGPTYRWGADDPDVNNKPDAITFGTGLPGGFDQATVTLNRDPRIDWPDLVELSTVTMYGLGGAAVAYQGRIEEFPSQAGSQSTFSPTIAGWQNHLQDDQYASAVFIDRVLANWSGPTTSRQIHLIGLGDQPSGSLSFQIGTDPANKVALLFTGTTPWSSTQNVEAWYGNGGPLLARIQASMLAQLSIDDVITNSSPNSLAVGFQAANDGTGAFNGDTLLTVPTSSYSKNASPAEPYATIQLNNAFGVGGSPPTGTTVGIYFENLAVIGNHGLTLKTGASGSSPGYDDGFLASDVLAYVLSQWCPKLAYTTGSSGSIQPSSFVIPQLAFPTATTPDAMITAATQFELLDWAVWEATTGTNGPTFYANARGARGKSWVARVGPAQLQNAGPQMSSLWNGVVVQWANVDGTTGIVGPPASGAPNTSTSLVDTDPTNPANILGINRWYLLTLGTSTLAGATQVGKIFLQEQALINTSGQAQLVGHVQDSSGVYWPSWMVRAGDTVSFVDAADSSPRRVTATNYSHSTRTNTISLDSPPDGMSALLDRLSAAISFTGFS